MVKKAKGAKIDIDDPKVKKYLICGVILLALISFVIGIGMSYNVSSEKREDLNQAADNEILGEIKIVTIQTEKGNIEIELYPKAMPITVSNFVKLIEDGFYDGLTFHRVEDWVIQGGCPRNDGTGGPGWSIELEVYPDLKNRRGMVAMARSSDPNSAGSQFYILKKDADWLDGEYAVFGKVIKGMDVVDKIEKGDKINSIIIDAM